MPNWFTGKQLPPTLANKRKRLKKEIRNASDADTEASESEGGCGRKRRRKNRSNPVKSSVFRESLCACDEDGDDEEDGNTSAPVTESQSFTSEIDDHSEWEVSDFFSSEDSFDEWLPLSFFIQVSWYAFWYIMLGLHNPLKFSTICTVI